MSTASDWLMLPIAVRCPAEKRRIRNFGPVTVVETSESDGPLKLYAFCKRSFPHISKSVLQKCFMAGNIIVNGISIRRGHDEESRRLESGDSVKVQIDLDAVDELIVNTTELNVLHIQKGFAILSKACGISAAFDKDFDKALKCRLWGGMRKKECHLLYHLEKGFSGICVVAETAENLLELRSLCCDNRMAEYRDSNHDNDSTAISDSCRDIVTDSTCDLGVDGNTILHPYQTFRISASLRHEPFMQIIHRCIICGKIGEIGELVSLETGHKDYRVIEASVVEISRCRSKGFISLIDIRVTFDEARMGVANGITDFDHDSITFNSDNSNSDDVVINKASDGEELDCYDQSKSSFPVELHTEPRSLSARTAFAVENIKHPHTAADYRYLHYPTLRLRTIKRALSLCGHQIVGDGGAVKSSKGIFAAIVSVTVYNPDYETHSSSDSVTLPAGEALPWKGCGDGVTARSSPLTVSVEDPKKFTKLMRKEQEMWDVAEARDRELLNAWDKQCIERDLQLGQAKEREANVADRGASTSFEKGSLSLAQEDSYSADSRQVDESIRAHRAPSSPTATSSSRSFSSLADMRAALASGMPVQYVLGEAFFCTYRFTVNPAVMVPRKSSEVLVEEALRVLSVDILPIMAAPKSCESETAVSNPNLGTGSSLAEQRVQNGLQELKCIEAQPGLVTLKMLDIGTGSGCLLLSCMKKCIELQHEVNPGQASSNRYRSEVDIQGLGIDLSHDALQVALENSTALSLQEKTDFKVLDFGNLSALVPGPILSKLVGSPSRVDVTDLQLAGDATDERQKIVSSGSPILDLPVSSPLGHVPTGHDSPPCAALGPFDIILCNPPYSSKRDTTRLSVACREHEPSLALFSPNGPLASYRVLASSLAAAEEKGDRNTRSMQNAASQDEIEAGCARKCVGLFTENGHLFLEVGHGQHLPVQKIFSKLPFLSFVRSAKDHKGIERCLVYRYCGNSVNSDAT